MSRLGDSLARGAHSAEGATRTRAASATCFLASRCTIVRMVSCDTPYAAAKARRLAWRVRAAISGQRIGSICGWCCAGHRSVTGYSTGK